MKKDIKGKRNLGRDLPKVFVAQLHYILQHIALNCPQKWNFFRRPFLICRKFSINPSFHHKWNSRNFGINDIAATCKWNFCLCFFCVHVVFVYYWWMKWKKSEEPVSCCIRGGKLKREKLVRVQVTGAIRPDSYGRQLRCETGTNVHVQLLRMSQEILLSKSSLHKHISHVLENF